MKVDHGVGVGGVRLQHVHLLLHQALPQQEVWKGKLNLFFKIGCWFPEFCNEVDGFAETCRESCSFCEA